MATQSPKGRIVSPRIRHEVGEKTTATTTGLAGCIVYVRTNAPARRQFAHMLERYNLIATSLSPEGDAWELVGEGENVADALERMEESGTVIRSEFIISTRVPYQGTGAGGGEGWKKKPLPTPQMGTASMDKHGADTGLGHVPGRKLGAGEVFGLDSLVDSFLSAAGLPRSPGVLSYVRARVVQFIERTGRKPSSHTELEAMPVD